MCPFAVRSPHSSLEAFLGSMGSTTLWAEALVIRSRKRGPVDLPAGPSYTLKPPSNRRLVYPSASPHRSLSLYGSTGMLTRFPSATPFGLALGPTNPERIDLPQETLGFRRTRFSRVLSLLVPAGSLPCPPPVLVGRASANMERSSTNHERRVSRESAASVSDLSPVELSARIHSTSELLRFL